MTKRSYQQYCPLAYALDQIGERWTLLIVRELFLGARRFSDLQRGLPGLSPNLLSQRLQSLESRGIIIQRPLPPPARLQAYALTPSGEALGQALAPLARWGMQFMQMPIPSDQFLGAVPAMSALHVLYRPSLSPEKTLTAEIHLEPDCFQLTLTSEHLRIEQGFLPKATLIFYTDPKTLIHLAGGQQASSAAHQNGDLRLIQGSLAQVERFFAQFALPDDFNPAS